MIIGEALCRGYCEALRNLLAELGIESLIICGGGMRIMCTAEDARKNWNRMKKKGL